MIQIDIPMPRDCVECPLTYPIHDGGAKYCCLTDVPEYIYRYGERPANCPLRKVGRMSVSLWRWTEKCEGKPCCGDCDECGEEEETNALNDLYARALDPEWQRAHRAMGFSSPIADLYDTLEELAKERSEEDDGKDE